MTDIAERASLKRRSQCDIAYGCFLILGLSSLVVHVVSLLPTPYDNALEEIAFLFGIPILIGSILALLIGIVFAILQWRHWQLLFLAAITILGMLPHGLTLYGWISAVVGTALPLWWFFVVRPADR
jgi:hypothetical protein